MMTTQVAELNWNPAHNAEYTASFFYCNSDGSAQEIHRGGYHDTIVLSCNYGPDDSSADDSADVFHEACIRLCNSATRLEDTMRELEIGPRTGEELHKISAIANKTSDVGTDANSDNQDSVTLLKYAPLAEIKLQDDFVTKNCGDTKLDALRTFRSEPDSLSESFLKGIIRNVEKIQDSVSSSAWVETLLEIAQILSAEAIRQQILPVALERAQTHETETSRLAATQLFAKLAARLDAHTNRFEVIPCVQALCQDPDPEVRLSMCSQLPLIAESISVYDWHMAIFPMLIELSQDSEPSVVDCAIEAVVSFLPKLDEATLSDVIVPLVKTACDRALAHKDRTTVTLAKCFGRLCTGLDGVLNTEDRTIFAQSFCRLCSMPLTIQLPLLQADEAMLVFAKTGLFKFKLLPIFNKLCQDPDVVTRKTIASGFHEIAKLLDDEAFLLTEHFIDFVRVGEIEVLDVLTEHLDETLEYLYKSGPSMDSNGNVVPSSPGGCSDRPKNPNHAAITSSLLYWVSSLKGSPNWRSQELILSKIGCLAKCLPSDELYAKVVPMLFDEILTQRAIPCRQAALESLLRVLRYIKRQTQRQFVLQWLREELCQGRSCHKRMLYVDGCMLALKHFSRAFCKQHFYDSLYGMAFDKVINIRLKICRILPKLRATLTAPTDSFKIHQIDAAVKHLLAVEKTPHAVEAVRQVIQELDNLNVHQDTALADLEDRRREEDEAILFAREFKEKQSAPVAPMPRLMRTLSFENGSGMMNGNSSSGSSSDKENGVSTHIPRLNYTLPPSPRRPIYDTRSKSATLDTRGRAAIKTAVVRPQFVSRSPSPHPSMDKDFIKVDSVYSNGHYSPPGESKNSSNQGIGVNRFTAIKPASDFTSISSQVSSYPSSSSANNGSLQYSTPKSNTTSQPVTRDHPIRLTHASTLLRPPTPVTHLRLGSHDRGNRSEAREHVSSLPSSVSANNGFSSSSSASQMPAVMSRSLPSTSLISSAISQPSSVTAPPVGRRSRLVPVVRNGTVKQNVQRFEVEPTGGNTNNNSNNNVHSSENNYHHLQNGYHTMNGGDTAKMNGGSHIPHHLPNGGTPQRLNGMTNGHGTITGHVIMNGHMTNGIGNGNHSSVYGDPSKLRSSRESPSVLYTRLNSDSAIGNGGNFSSTQSRYKTLPINMKERNERRPQESSLGPHTSRVIVSSTLQEPLPSPLVKVKSASNLPQKIPQQSQILWRRFPTTTIIPISRSAATSS